jgi:hypothetical protein
MLDYPYDFEELLSKCKEALGRGVEGASRAGGAGGRDEDEEELADGQRSMLPTGAAAILRYE